MICPFQMVYLFQMSVSSAITDAATAGQNSSAKETFSGLLLWKGSNIPHPLGTHSLTYKPTLKLYFICNRRLYLV